MAETEEKFVSTPKYDAEVNRDEHITEKVLRERNLENLRAGMPDDESDTKAFVVVYADVCYGANEDEAFSSMDRSLHHAALPVCKAMEVGLDDKFSEYPGDLLSANIDGAVEEKLDEFAEELWNWAKGQKVSD